MSKPFEKTGNTSPTGIGTLPRSRAITAAAVFAALAIILHTSPLKIPAPYAPFLIYELWEIPIIAAFFLYGARLGISVAIINFLSLMIIFPGQIQSGPIYNLIAIFSMMLGILLAYRMAGLSSRLHSNAWLFWLALILGVSARVAVMTVVNVLLLPMPPPLGFSIPFEAIPAMLPLLAIFNSSVTLYTIPIARAVTTAVSSTTRIPARYGR
ncbi:MAG: hypothetical protein V3W09_00450 [Nitrososphaerales archaeon]